MFKKYLLIVLFLCIATGSYISTGNSDWPAGGSSGNGGGGNGGTGK